MEKKNLQNGERKVEDQVPNKALVKHAGGRPTKYLPASVFPKIEEYLGQCSKEQLELPTVEGLALYLGVNGDTLVEWGNQYPEFSATIKKILMKQKTQLMNDGMYGGKEVNAGMAIFLLKCNHGMNDGSNVQINQQFNFGKVLEDERKEFGV